MGAVQSLVSSDWLLADTTAAQAGHGPVPAPQGGTVPQVPVSVHPSPLAPETIGVPEPGSEVLYEGSHAGPWPTVPASGTSASEPVQRGTGGQDATGDRSSLPAYDGSVIVAIEHPGTDAHYQVTDTHGWAQNTPSGRTAVMQSWRSDQHGYAEMWAPVSEQPVTAHLARAEYPLTGPAYGQVSPLGFPAPQDTAYQTPAGPVSGVAGSAVIDSGYAAGWA